MGLDEVAQGEGFYLALVRFLGCTSFAPEASRYGGGDDISVGTVMGLVDPDELDAVAVRRVLDAAGVASRVRTEWRAGLTDSEVEVLCLVAQGGTNKDVACALGISPRTVQHHVAHIYDKVGVASCAGAALFAAENGLTGPEGPSASA